MSAEIKSKRDKEDALFNEVVAVCTRYEFFQTDWQKLIEKLGLGEDFIRSIAAEHANKPLQEKIRRAFDRWRMSRGGTITEVCKELESVLRAMKLTRIAEDVEELCIKVLGDEYRKTKTQNHKKDDDRGDSASSVGIDREPSMTEFRPKHPPPGMVSSVPPHSSPLKRHTLPLMKVDEIAQPVVGNFVKGEPISLPKRSKNPLPTDMSELSDGRLIVCDYNNECVYILGQNQNKFNLQRTIRGADNGLLQKPLRIAAWRDLILVSSSGKNTISVYSIISDTMLTSLDVDMDPLALSVYGDTLYVGGRAKIVRFSLTKTEKRIMCIEEMTYTTKSPDAVIQYITSCAGGKIIASTGWTTNEIIMWHVSNPKPIAIGRNLADPQGLCMLDDNHVLVGEWRIGTITRVGIYKQEFSPDVKSLIPNRSLLVRPGALHFLAPNTVIVVTDEDRKLAVFNRN